MVRVTKKSDTLMTNSYQPLLQKRKAKRFVPRMLTRLMDWMTYSRLLNKLQKEGSSGLSMGEKLTLTRLTKL